MAPYSRRVDDTRWAIGHLKKLTNNICLKRSSYASTRHKKYWAHKNQSVRWAHRPSFVGSGHVWLSALLLDRFARLYRSGSRGDTDRSKIQFVCVASFYRPTTTASRHCSDRDFNWPIQCSQEIFCSAGGGDSHGWNIRSR